MNSILIFACVLASCVSMSTIIFSELQLKIVLLSRNTIIYLMMIFTREILRPFFNTVFPYYVFASVDHNLITLYDLGDHPRI